MWNTLLLQTNETVCFHGIDKRSIIVVPNKSEKIKQNLRMIRIIPILIENKKYLLTQFEQET